MKKKQDRKQQQRCQAHKSCISCIYTAHTHSRERERQQQHTFWLPPSSGCFLGLHSLLLFFLSQVKKKEPPCGHARRNGKKETRPSGRIYDQTKQKERRKKKKLGQLRSPPLFLLFPMLLRHATGKYSLKINFNIFFFSFSRRKKN